jgi:protein SCO1
MASWCSTVLVFSAVLVLSGCSNDSGLPKLGAVPDFQLTDQNGHDFLSAAQLKSEIWIADFIFTNCPGPCPRMSSQMKHVQTFLSGTGIKLVSFTVDPANDTPEVLFEYSRHYDARPGTWYFLTGPKDTLHGLSKKAFKLDVDDDLQHSTHFVLVDRQGQIRGYYQTLEDHAVDQIVADARALLKERT